MISDKRTSKADAKFLTLLNKNIASNPSVDNATAIKNALKEMGDSSAYVSETLKKTGNSAASATDSIVKTGIAAKAASIGMKVLAAAGNMAVVALLSWGATKLFQLLDEKVFHLQETLDEAFSTAKAEYEESESTLQSLQSELDTTKSKIEELYRASNGSLNIVEQEDLDSLNREVKLLERQIELEERKRDLARAETRESAVKSLNNELAPIEVYSGLQYDATVSKYLDEPQIRKFGTTRTEYVYGDEVEYVEFDALAQAKIDRAALKEAQKEYAEAQDAWVSSELKEGDKGYQALFDRMEDAQKDVDYLQGKVQASIDTLEEKIGDDERISDNGHLTNWEKQFNGYFDVYDYNQDTIAMMSDNEAESVFNLLQERYADEFDEVRKTVGNGVELTAEEFKRLWPEVAKAIEDREIDLEDAVEYLNDTFAKVSTPTTPTIPDASTLASSLYKTTEAYTAINDAIEEQASAGKISFDTMQELLKINPDFINALEKTADGYKISTDALMDYVEAQDLLEYTEAINAIANLNAELNNTDISDARRAEIQSEIQQYKMLVNEIENATGALSKYRAAKATENQDADFQEGATMYDEIKEARKIGKTGTDDFQTAVGFMLGEDWEQQYSDREAAYKEAEKRAERYFGQETESDNYINFFDDLVKNNLATKENGQFVFDNVSIEEIADRMQMSVDAVRSLFMLAEAYGAKFEYDFEVDTSEVEHAQAVVDNLYERKGEIQAELDATPEEVNPEKHAQLENELKTIDADIEAAEASLEAVSGKTAYTLDEAIARIQELEGLITSLSGMGFDIPVTFSGEYDALQNFFTTFATQIVDDAGNVIGWKFEIDGLEEAESTITAITNFTNSAKENESISLPVRLFFEEESNKVISTISSYINEEAGEQKITFVLGADDQVTSAIDKIQEEKSDNEVIVRITDNGTGKLVQETIDAFPSEKILPVTLELEEETYSKAKDELDELTKPRTVQIGTELESNGPLGWEALTTNEKAEAALTGTGLAATRNESGTYTVTDPFLYFQDLISEVHEATGKIPTTDELQAACKTALDNGEVSFDPDSVIDIDTYAASALEAYRNNIYSNGGAAQAQTSVAPIDIDLDTSSASEKVDELKEDISDISSDTIELDTEDISDGFDIKELNAYSNQLLGIADSYGVAQQNQESFKTATEELNTAYANLQNTDPANVEGWQAASEQFNSAVANYQAAYNVLASDLQSIDPINVKANIASAQKSINSLNGKTVTINVQTNTIPSISASGGSESSSASTGVKKAKGTTHARNGMSLVDEEGAELIEHVSEGTYELGTNKGPRFTKLNEGDVVHTASETKKILSRMGSGIGGFFRDGLNNAKAIVGRAFAFSTVKYKNKNTGATTTVNRTTTTVSGSVSSNPGTSSSSSSSSSSKKKKSSSSSSKKKVKKLQDYLASLFDWIEVKLTRLQEQTDGWIAEAAEAIGYWAKNGKLDNALASISKQIKANTDGAARYLEQANAIAEQYEIPDDVVKLIQEGTIDITEYDDDKQEKIKAYQEWYDKAIACQTAVRDLKEQEKELIKQKLDNIIDHYEMRTKLYDSQIGALDAQLDYKKASGGRINILDYAFSLADSKKKAEEISKEMHDLTAEFTSMLASGDIVEGSEEYYEYLATISKLNESLAETNTSIIEIEDNIKKIDLTELQWALSAIERSAASIQNSMNLHEAQGLDHVADDYASLIRNGMEQIEIWEKENEELREMQKGLDVNSEKYQEYQEQINANIDSIASMKVSQEQWNDAILDLDIKKIQDYRDELTKQNTAYQNQLNLQQSLENLEKAKSQRTQRVYREGVGFTYEADQDAIQDAQQAFDQELHNQTLSKLDEILEAIEDSKADTNVYDANGVLLGEQYTLPSIDYSTLLATAGKQSITDATMNDLKKAAAEMVLSGVTSSTGGTTLQIGDIVVQGVDNANALAEALIDEFPNAFLQALYSK